ncbi:MAG: 1,4-dihydroxy-2-naphthoate polyprenyltransferase [Enterobacteriaceae bacterium]
MTTKPDSISKTSAWVESLRPRTLPLALAAIITGSALAAQAHHFKAPVALLALLTAALLQILSNLANDYGDAVKGSDTPSRIGPLRGMQKGVISLAQMKKALMITTGLTTVSGLALIIVACEHPEDIVGFLFLGLAAIVAAITYTVGRKPYGYLGLGDLSVLIFFGWLSVGGTFYLQAGTLHALVMLPATACGLLATGVLNINNLRDIEADKLNGKNTLAVRLGPRGARYYHACLLAGTLLSLTLFAIFNGGNGFQWLFILSVPLLYGHGRQVLLKQNAIEMRPMLEQMVKLALLTNLLFSMGILLS